MPREPFTKAHGHRLPFGHHSHASSAQDGPFPDFGERPVVGQTAPYNSTNARGKNEKAASHDWTAGDAAASAPRQSRGWPARSPSK